MPKPASDFPFARYNRFGVLRVNALTAACVLFLSRHVLAFIVLGIALSRTDPSSRQAFHGLFEPVYMLADVPALLVLLAMLSRHPKSGRVLRVIWRGGRWLLAASAVLYLGLLIRQVGPDPVRYGWAIGSMVAGTLLSTGYVHLSPYARTLFREFPDASLAEDDTGRT